MDEHIKLKKFLNAIDDIEDFEDGSIIIRWKGNVSHEVPGHLLNITEGSVILKGHQVHLNPELTECLKGVKFNKLQQELDRGIEEARKNINSNVKNVLPCGSDV